MVWPICFAALLALTIPACGQELRLGIVGTDSTHATEFTSILNDASDSRHVSGARVVAAYRGGNPSLALSRDRIEKISAELQTKFGVRFVSDIAGLCGQVDGLLILSVDPSSRLREVREAARCGKPMFIDKPLAGSLRGAEEIAAMLRSLHGKWFSASALRFAAQPDHATAHGAEVWGPGELSPARSGYGLDLAWYGIHSIEAMYALMGPGVKRVARSHTDREDTLFCVWGDGRAATVHLLRPDFAFGAVVFDRDGAAPRRIELSADYGRLVQAIVEFVRTGKAPVSPAQALETFQLMGAAQKSLERHGDFVSLP